MCSMMPAMSTLQHISTLTRQYIMKNQRTSRPNRPTYMLTLSHQLFTTISSSSTSSDPGTSLKLLNKYSRLPNPFSSSTSQLSCRTLPPKSRVPRKEKAKPTMNSTEAWSTRMGRKSMNCLDMRDRVRSWKAIRISLHSRRITTYFSRFVLESTITTTDNTSSSVDISSSKTQYRQRSSLRPQTRTRSRASRKAKTLTPSEISSMQSRFTDLKKTQKMNCPAMRQPTTSSYQKFYSRRWAWDLAWDCSSDSQEALASSTTRNCDSSSLARARVSQQARLQELKKTAMMRLVSSMQLMTRKTMKNRQDRRLIRQQGSMTSGKLLVVCSTTISQAPSQKSVKGYSPVSLKSRLPSPLKSSRFSTIIRMSRQDCLKMKQQVTTVLRILRLQSAMKTGRASRSRQMSRRHPHVARQLARVPHAQRPIPTFLATARLSTSLQLSFMNLHPASIAIRARSIAKQAGRLMSHMLERGYSDSFSSLSQSGFLKKHSTAQTAMAAAQKGLSSLQTRSAREPWMRFLPCSSSLSRILTRLSSKARFISNMTQIEETLARLKDINQVKNFVILNYNGNIVRAKNEKSKDGASQLGNTLTMLTKKAKSFVRDLEPTNELTFMRIGFRGYEILIAPDKEFILVVYQSLAREAEIEKD